MPFARPLIALWALLVFTGFLSSAPFPNGVVRRMTAAMALPAPPPGVPAPSIRALVPSWAANARGACWAALLAAAAWGAGCAAAPLLRLPSVPSAAVPAAAGLVMCGTAALGLGLSGLAYPGLLRAGALFAAAPGIRSAARACRRLRRIGIPGGGWAFAGLAATAALWGLAAFNPEPGIDAYLYHLRLPFIYAHDHRVHHVWHHIHAQVPQVWELLLMLPAPADAATAAQVLSALTIAPVLALAIAFGGGGGAAVFAAVLLTTSPLLVAIGTSAYTDLPLAWLGAASFALLVMPHASPSPARRFAAGAVLGGACALKYAAFPVVAACGVWLIAGAARRRAAGWWVPAAAGLLAVMLPWMGWNWLAAGNPVAPFLSRFFPDALPALPFAERLSGAVFRRPMHDVLASPWSAYVASEPFLFVSPALVAAAPALIFARGALAAIPGSGVWIATAVAAWAVLIADERFLLPAAPVIAGLLARGGWLRMPRWAVALFLALNLAGVARQVFMPAARLWTTLGLVERPAYLRATLQPSPGYADAACWLNANAGERDRVMVVSDDKSHLVWRECVTDHVYDYPSRLVWILWGVQPDPNRVAVRFRELGLRWVLYLPGRAAVRLRDMPDLFDFRPGEAAAWDGFWTRHARLAWSAPGAAIYGLRTGAGVPVDLPDLPGVQEVMEYSARLTMRREGPAAVVMEVRRYATAYRHIGEVHRLAGEVLGSVGPDALSRAEGRRELAVAEAIDRAAGRAR